LSLRAAIGAGRSRLIRQLLTESALLSLAGAALGTLFAIACVRYVGAKEAAQLPPGNPVSVNWEVLAFTILLAILTRLLFGIVPAWSASRIDLNESLKQSSPATSGGSMSLQVASFEYPGLIASVRVTQDTESPSISRFMGSRGIVEIAAGQVTCTPQPGIDLKPSYYDSSYPQAMRIAYEKQWHVDNDASVARVATSEKQTYSFLAEDITTRQLQVFFDAVQTRQLVVEDVVFGHHAAAASHMANQSYFKGAPITKESAV
jgi:FtsX-like permease family